LPLAAAKEAEARRTAIERRIRMVVVFRVVYEVPRSESRVVAVSVLLTENTSIRHPDSAKPKIPPM
jgi:hypothetical protein